MEIDWSIVGGGVLGSGLTLAVTWMTSRWQRRHAHHDRLRQAYEEYLHATESVLTTCQAVALYAQSSRALAAEISALEATGKLVGAALTELERAKTNDSERVERVRQEVDAEGMQLDGIREGLKKLQDVYDKMTIQWTGSRETLNRRFAAVLLIDADNERLELLRGTQRTPEMSLAIQDESKFLQEVGGYETRRNALMLKLRGAFAPK